MRKLFYLFPIILLSYCNSDSASQLKNLRDSLNQVNSEIELNNLKDSINSENERIKMRMEMEDRAKEMQDSISKTL